MLQHAHNPVEWYPWGEEALRRACEENKPILLSIGYSACHWCHVMAHESFEDEETAALMNRYFINIKVDREERPDLDRIYQLAHQLLTRRPGGWPLTMVLTPDQTPFVGGTYFPPVERHGLPAFRDILQRIHDLYTGNRDGIETQNQSMLKALGHPAAQGPGQLDDTPLHNGVEELQESFDAVNGGFGGAPKFPHVGNLLLLLRQPEQSAQVMALFTLRRMAEGGLQDQLGGGFYRYAVDERWEIPHFEKMLYDNGPLLQCYVEAWQLSGDDYYREVAERCAGWAMREMQSAEGGYCASQDADTDGEEGGFYVWSREALQTLLGAKEYAVASRHFGLTRPANFEGRWHLKIAEPLAQSGAALGIGLEKARTLRDSAVEKLLAARREQAVLGRDDKVLGSWNGLMIKGMACAGLQFGRPDLIASAERALAFIGRELLRDGRLLASYKDGQAKYSGYLDDYAFLIDALLALLQARWSGSDLQLACDLAEVLLEHFEDESQGGFYFTADDHEPLIQRPKPFMDESMPAGNGVAASALLRLGHLTGDLHFLDAAEKTLHAGWQLLSRYPSAHGAMLGALQEYLQESELYVLRGEAAALEPWRNKLLSGYHPHRLVVAIPPDAAGLPGALAQKTPSGEAVAYHCLGLRCLPPITSIDSLPD
ncbi:MAG TPA: thioredoxin domain-containing protein [Gammaproteobacteria bacterium]